MRTKESIYKNIRSDYKNDTFDPSHYTQEEIDYLNNRGDDWWNASMKRYMEKKAIPTPTSTPPEAPDKQGKSMYEYMNSPSYQA